MTPSVKSESDFDMVVSQKEQFAHETTHEELEHKTSQKHFWHSKLGINRVITEEESSQMMSESASLKQSSSGLKNCLNNLLNMDAKNVSYSIHEDSKLTEQSRDARTKEKSVFAFK